jgi:hypothetical protein
MESDSFQGILCQTWDKGGFPIFLGCRPFSAENCPLDSFPGAPNPLNPFGPKTFG